MCLFIANLVARAYGLILGQVKVLKYNGLANGTVTAVYTRRAPWPGAVAMTIGRVMIMVRGKVDQITVKHEAVHVKQWEKYKCLFPVVYAWASIVSLVKHGNLYWNNWMEEEARREAGEG